jgi:hypothetical protein
MRRLIIAALCAGFVAIPASAARGDDGGTDRTSLDREVAFTEAPAEQAQKDVQIVSTAPFAMVAGQARHVRTRLEARSSTEGIVAMDNKVKCFELSNPAAVVGPIATTARNHEGSDAYNGAGRLALLADLLFVAPRTATYRCALWGWTASSMTTPYALHALPGVSWIEVSKRNQPGSAWWQNPTCGPTGSAATCTYVGAGVANPPVAFALYRDGSETRRWTPHRDAKGARAFANVTLTTCYAGTASCARSDITPYQLKRGIPHTVVRIQLEVIQLDDRGRTCETTRSALEERTISDDAHHFSLNMSIPRIAIAACGSNEFIVRIRVERVSGKPVKIDGTSGATSLTNAMLLNLYS